MGDVAVEIHWAVEIYRTYLTVAMVKRSKYGANDMASNIFHHKPLIQVASRKILSWLIVFSLQNKVFSKQKYLFG